jgi:type IV pilus biogenesis protein CpaD/CtpE
MFRAALLILSIASLAGCATNVTMTGKAHPPVAPTQVKILFKEKPKCNFEELGFISTPQKWNQNIAIESAREKAANIGADYLVIEMVHQNIYNDASVSAMAYKCGSVDREKVEVNPSK